MVRVDTRAWWSRRGFLKARRRRGGGAYGLSSRRGACRHPRSSSTARNSSSRRRSPTQTRRRAALSASPMRPPHFDVHQSGTINNLGAQGCMFDNLIRRDPRDSGKTIIPDLAHSWEIAKDGKTYTFFLRKGVQFHDGAELTAEDVKATFDRIAKPPQGISIPRSILFKAVERDQRARQIHRRVQAVRAAAGQLHHVGDRQRLERHRPQEDAGGQQLQSAQGRRSIPAPARSRACGGSRTKSG